MSTATATQTEWMTGDEFNREYRKLVDRGVAEEDPEMRALFRRMSERNHWLFERYGKPLISKYPDWLVAISPDGKTLVGQRRGELAHEAEEKFGTYDFALFRLSEMPYDTLGARLVNPV